MFIDMLNELSWVREKVKRFLDVCRVLEFLEICVLCVAYK